MRKIIVTALLTLATITSSASARTMTQTTATRVGPDHYVLANGADLHTTGCTESARDQWVVVDVNGIESVVHFLDADGEVEETCRLASAPKRLTVASRAR